jgi:O-antigen/teichoic acid export membrane protein
MTTVRRNLVASFFGRGWTAALQVLLVPIFLKLLGAESYALVGFYALLYSVVARLDLGLSTTLNREFARARAVTDDDAAGEPAGRSMGDLLRTLEFIYVAVAVIVGVSVAAAAPFLAQHWLRGSVLGPHTVSRAIALMGIVVAAQWPISLYEGGLRGLERQTVLNGIGASMATVRGLGAVAVLLWVSRSIDAYFVWQAIANLFHLMLLAVATWRLMPRTAKRPRFRGGEVRAVARFTAGISGISILSLVLTQADKVVLSRMLPLAAFGYYNVAANLAAGLAVVSVPLFEAIFPRLSALLAAGATDQLRRTYHASMQLSAVLVIPASVVLLLFGRDVAQLWLHDAVAVEQTHLLIGLLSIGTAVNVLMTMPFALQLASGWTRLSLYKNVIALACTIPLLLLLVARFGAVGAAVSWIAINVGYLVWELPYMHRRLLRGALRRVYVGDLGGPALFAVLGAASVKLLAVSLNVPPLASVALAIAASLAGAVLASPLARTAVSGWGPKLATAVGRG